MFCLIPAKLVLSHGWGDGTHMETCAVRGPSETQQLGRGFGCAVPAAGGHLASPEAFPEAQRRAMESHITLGEGGQSPSRLLESKTYEVAGKLTLSTYCFQTPTAYAFYSHLLRPFVSPCYGKETKGERDNT